MPTRQPSDETISRHDVASLTQHEWVARSLQHPEAFWKHAATKLSWMRFPEQVYAKIDRAQEHQARAEQFQAEAARDIETVPYRWFPDGELNACYNLLDRHVEAGKGTKPAIIFDSPVTKTQAIYTYAELRAATARLAGVLQNYGVGVGDRVVIYMPMIPQALMAMLACVRLGAIHSVVFGGFAAPELAKRIASCQPKLILTASCGIEVSRVIAYPPIVAQALEIAGMPDLPQLIYEREQYRISRWEPTHASWQQRVDAANEAPCVPVNANHPAYILYTSGTTGQPKGVVRDTAGYLVALAWSMEALYDIQEQDVFWSASDVGWVVGHSYIVYAPLLIGATTVVYEGKPVGTPDAGAFWRVISQYQVKAMFTAPTAIRAIRREDPNGQHIDPDALKAFQYLFLAGERCDPETLLWVRNHLNVDVIDNWWQTETGWAIAGTCMGTKDPLPIKVGSPSAAVAGYDLHVLRADGQPAPANTMGAIALKLPLPPGSLLGLWGRSNRLHTSYLEQFPGFYRTGDIGHIDQDGYLFVMGRSDDVLNVAGHRLSAGRLEEVIAQHAAVAECVVVGALDDLKGEIPIAFLTTIAQVNVAPEDLYPELNALVRSQVGAIASLKAVVRVKRLPKTRSGKILRATIRSILNQQPFDIPPTIDDPTILEEIAQAVKTQIPPTTKTP